MGKRAIAFLVGGLVAVAGVLGTTSCIPRSGPDAKVPRGTSQWKPPRIVRVEGVEVCANFSRGLRVLTPVIGMEGRPMGLYVGDGDLLIVFWQEVEGDMFFYPYEESDGMRLSFQIEDFRLLEGETTVTLALSDDDVSWQWLEKASEEELKELRLLQFSADIEALRSPLLEKLAKVNPNVALVLEEDVPSILELLELFRPRRFFLPDAPLEEKDIAAISQQGDLETLWLGAKGLHSLEFLSGLPKLKNLVIGEWDPEKTGGFPAGCRSLRSLNIVDSSLKDLSSIAPLRQLEELTLFECKELSDVSALGGFSRLRALVILGSPKVKVSALPKFPRLRWLSVGQEMSQEEFARLIAAYPGLEVLELADAGDITDLSPLLSLRKLQGLIFPSGGEELLDWTVLGKIKTLRFLGLPTGTFEKSPDKIKELEKALPECLIVPAGICLGSGWILMLFPLVALGWLLSVWRRKKRQEMLSTDA